MNGPDERPVAGATVAFSEQLDEPCTPTADVDEDRIVSEGSTITDAAGTFVVELYSTAGEQCLIVTAAAASDTAKVWQATEWKLEGSVPDTLRLTLTLGED